MNNNLSIYEKVRDVPDTAKKQFDNGTFKGTDINPMWRIKVLTDQFGPCGIGWYYEVLSERAEAYGETVMAIVDLNLYIKVNGEWSKPIYGTGGNTLVKATTKGLKPSDEGYKMALTDALSVACKALGIGADVYFEKDAMASQSKYSANNVAPNEEPEMPYNAWDKAHRDMNFNPRIELSKKAVELNITAEVFDTCRRALIKAGKLEYKKNDDLTMKDIEEITAAVRKYILEGGLQQ